VVYPPGSPAASAAIEPGDIIAGANSQKLDSATSILRFIVTQHLGTPIPLLVWRHDQMQNAVVRGAPWPEIRAMRSNVLARPASVAQAQAAGIGLHLAPINVASHERDGGVNISAVLVDRVTPGSQAAAMGVKAGDIIERVDEQAATTPAEAMDQLTLGSHADGDPVALLVSAKAGRR